MTLHHIALATALALLAAPAPKKPAPKPTAKAPTKPAAPKPPLAPPKPSAFAPAELDLAPGSTYPVELFMASPTGHAYTGKLVFAPDKGLTVQEDTRFSGKVPPWGVKVFPKVTVAVDATGDLTLAAGFEKGEPAKLVVHVGEPAVEVTPGVRELKVKITNPFVGRPMTGRVVASNRDRFLQDVTTREFKIPPGESGEVVFPLPGAAPVESESYDFTITVQTYTGYKSTKTYSLMFPPHTQ